MNGSETETGTESEKGSGRESANEIGSEKKKEKEN